MERAGLSRLDAAGLWGAVLAAAAGARDGAAGAAADLCTLAGSPRLGWVSPAPWPAVERAVTAALDALQPRAERAARWPADHPVLLLGTGGWSFAARALCESTAVAGPRLVPLDSLSPARIRRALAGTAPGPVRAVAVSGSGTTLETGRLAEVVEELTGAARILWLRDEAAPPGAVALSVRGAREHVAMLGAPLSTSFLLPAAQLHGPALEAAYARLHREHRTVGAAAAREATRGAASGAPLVHVVAPTWAGPGLRLWLTQLGRQVLCGKSDRFRPRFEVVPPGYAGAAPDVRFRLDTYRPDLADLLELLYRAGVFVACLALRAGIPVAQHAHVRAYKRLLDRAGPEPALPAARGSDLPAVAAAWLAGCPERTRLHVVRYGADPPIPDEAQFAAATGRQCEVHEGSAWNHHSFQAVYADPTTAVLLVAEPPTAAEPPALAAAARTLRRVAAATAQALAGRARLVELAPPAPPGQGGAPTVPAEVLTGGP